MTELKISKAKRIQITWEQLAINNTFDMPEMRGKWSANWVHYPDTDDTPFVIAYRRLFVVEKDITVCIHVTADERYDLFLDGKRIGRGPERGDAYNWFYESYELELIPGKHTLVARVWSLGDILSPLAQISLKHGFLMMADKPYEKVLNTGVASWDTKRLDGFTFRYNEISWGAGSDLTVNGEAYDWDACNGQGSDWKPVQIGELGVNAMNFADYSVIGHQLKPAMLPPMFREKRHVGVIRHVDHIKNDRICQCTAISKLNLIKNTADWSDFLTQSKAVTVEAGKKIRIIIDLQNYYCAYPCLMTSLGSGSSIRIHWAESLYEKSQNNPSYTPKGNRDEIEGKFFIGVGDTFNPDGGVHRLFETLWWRAGRYIELFIQTADEPLILEKFIIEDVRYPLKMESSFRCNEPEIANCWQIMIRSVQMCSHETFVDCPYYEQLMYVGDSRLSALNFYCMTRDSLLPRKSVELFGLSRIPSGLTRSRHPSRAMQIIAPFSLWWIAMVYDYALWRGDREFIIRMMPEVRGVIDSFLNQRNDDNLIISPNGWNFMDWVPEWERGVPPDGENGISAVINWQFVLVLTMVAKLEQWMGEMELTTRTTRIAVEMSRRLTKTFWNDKRGLFADDMSGQHFSEHTQCLALLSELLNDNVCKRIEKELFSNLCLTQTTIYFSHYYFETCRFLNRIDKLFERLSLWFNMQQQGFKTTFEQPGNTRSDCHAWGAHPIYHTFATIMGIRPASFGFGKVKIAPQLGSLNSIDGVFVHPLGEIKVELQRKDSSLKAIVSLPEGLSGYFVWNGEEKVLFSGTQKILF